jgi:hypothetical protein
LIIDSLDIDYCHFHYIIDIFIIAIIDFRLIDILFADAITPPHYAD